MKSDINGCSTCQNGNEQIESFYSRGRPYIQYDYRTEDGRLFSCCCMTLKEARQRRDKWIIKGD
jgi:hypothetical protein